MGLASLLLGEQNPFAQWTGQNSNLLGALGAGLASGPDFSSGIAQGLQMAPQAKAMDYQMAEKKKADALTAEQVNQTKQWLEANYPQYAHLPPDQGFKLAMEAEGAKYKGGSGLINAGDGSIYDPNTKQWIHDPSASKGAGGPYAGTGMDAQNWNILLGGDPSSPEYAAAWAQISAPRVTYKETVDGIVPVYETPAIPDSIRRPAGMAVPAPVAAPAPAAPNSAIPAPGGAPTAAPAAPAGGGISTGSVLPGTKAKPTEAQLRNGSIGTVLASEIPKVGANFKALTDPTSQLLAVAGPLGNPWQSEQYQQAATALGSSVSQILYSLSGATANPNEVQKQIQYLTPALGDKPATIADKMDRFKTLTRAVAKASGDPEVIKMVEDAIASLGLDGASQAAPIQSSKYPGVTIKKLQ